MTKAAKKEIVTKPGSEISVVNLDINSEKIAVLALRCAELPQDLKNPENYRLSQNVINEAREMRGKITTAGKGLKEDAAKWLKKVVKDEKRLDAEITAFLEPEAARKKVHDDEVKAEKERLKKVEQLRKDTHLANINGIRILISKAQGQPSEKIEEVIAELEGIIIDDTFEEFKDEAQNVHDDTDFALSKMLLDTQTTEEADRKRVIEDERLRVEAKKIADQTAENERIRLANEKVTRDNEAAAQKIIDDKAAALKASEQKEIEPKQETVEPVHGSGISPSAQKAADEDNSVVAQCRKKSLIAIDEVISNFEGGNNLALAEDVLSAIQTGKIPNVTYSIY